MSATGLFAGTGPLSLGLIAISGPTIDWIKVQFWHIARYEAVRLPAAPQVFEGRATRGQQTRAHSRLASE
jgi:hypothetical protein